ncbi:esterase-like activity of phytase family protein [Streptomyces sp. HNM0574]|nr:esterase-like activity of phytase family protein [Streptomyces sp. HNM0574]
MRSGAAVAAALVCALVGPASGVAAADGQEGDGPEAFTLRDKRIDESSGLAASRAHEHVYWTHNDSDDGPRVYAVDGRTGRTVATVTLQGIDPRDVEAIAVGPDGDVYVADIGDNLGGTWPEVWIYRFPEPKQLRDVTVTPTRYTVRYEDGPRDAESLMVHPKTGRVYIASKNNKERGGIYAGPEELSPSGVNTFRRIADTEIWATDGAFSPDGTRLMLRSYFGGEMYVWRDGKPDPIDDMVPVPMQRQGESVTFTPDGRTLMFGSEGRHSTVDPVELDGTLLPENAARPAPERDRGSDNQDTGSGDRNEVAIGGVTFAIAIGAWMLLRGLLRRRR